MTIPPKVSVIIPTCGRPKLLLECIASIIRNDFADFEVLIIDQAPARTLQSELSATFTDTRLRYFSLDEAALDKARNKGIAEAGGEIIVFVDDDVEVEQDWLRAYVEAFGDIEPTPGLVGGPVDPLWLSPKPNWLPEERQYLLGIYNQGNNLIPTSVLPIGANFAIRRPIINQVGKFDERLDYSYARKTSLLSGGDSLFCLKVKQANYPVYYQPRARVWHKISKNKLTKSYFLRRTFWDGVTIIAVMYLTQSASSTNALRIIGWHSREIICLLWRAVFSKNTSSENLLQDKARMRLAANCAYSLGIIYAGLKLLWTKQLP
jgi:glucosyl-dolichyl phosphate glucuronosyltransferase